MNDQKGFFWLIFNVLKNPSESFSYIKDSDLLKGLLIEVVIVVLAVLSTMTYSSKIPLEVLMPQLAGVDPLDIPTNINLLSGVGVGASILVGWILSTLIMHGVCHLLGGGGSLTRFFAIHGFASIPYMFNYILRVVDAYVISQETLVDYFLLNKGVESKFLSVLLNMNFFNVFGFGVLFLVVNGLMENYRLSRGKSLATALVPWLLYFSLNYFRLG